VNKKVSGLALVSIFLVMLATPLVGTAIAGKGQEKLDFRFHLDGAPVPMSFDKIWVVGNEDSIVQIRGLNWAGEFFIEIGTGGSVETIDNDYLDYQASMDLMMNNKQGFFVITVREVISIYSSDTLHDETTLRGTLEIQAQGYNPAGTGANFVGFGTGDFEGVKVSGVTTALIPGAIMDRVGTVMGWPT